MSESLQEWIISSVRAYLLAIILWLKEIYVTVTLQSLMDRGMGARNNTTNRSGAGPAVRIRSCH